MKATELMIGDWVRNDLGETQQVAELHENWAMLSYNDTYPYDWLEPIPITPEILEKNGFRDIDKGENCDGFDIYWRNGNDGYSINTQDLHLHYVHELQHALRLCGIDKTIEL